MLKAKADLRVVRKNERALAKEKLNVPPPPEVSPLISKIGFLFKQTSSANNLVVQKLLRSL